MRQQIARALSSTASRGATPIPVFGVAGNYAQAVYTAAKSKDASAQVSKDLAAFSEAMKNSNVSEYMADPFIEGSKKMALLDKVTAEKKMSPLVSNLFGLLAENHRLGLVGEIADVYARIVQAEAGFTPVHVTSAVALSKAQEKEISAAVAAIAGSSNVEMTTSVNADLVGGLVVSIGDKYTEMQHVDLSTSSKLQKYRAILSQTM